MYNPYRNSPIKPAVKGKTFKGKCRTFWRKVIVFFGGKFEYRYLRCKKCGFLNPTAYTGQPSCKHVRYVTMYE
jgi:hypothetical protein